MVKEKVDPRKPKPGETRAEYQERRKKEIEKAKKPKSYAQQREAQKRHFREYAQNAKEGTQDKLDFTIWYNNSLASEHEEKALAARKRLENAQKAGNKEEETRWTKIKAAHERKAKIRRLQNQPLEEEKRNRNKNQTE